MYGDLDRIGFGRTRLLLLVFLAFVAVLLATFPIGRLLGGGVSGAATVSVYVAAVTVALVAVQRASRSGEDGGFWGFVGWAVVLRFVGNVGWISVGYLGLPAASQAVHDIAYALSYVAMISALYVLVTGAVSGLPRITVLVALDACCIALSVGLMVWYFAFGGTSDGISSNGQATLMFVLKPAADAALLSVALLLYAGSRRPVFVPYLTAALVCLLFADALHLAFPGSGLGNLGGWPEALRAVGFVLLCLGALRSVGEKEMSESGGEVRRGALSFWFGPLSPALHCAVLLVWGAVAGPLPYGVMILIAVIVGYVAVRSGITARINRSLRREREKLIAQKERVRISEELHDSLKQELHTIPLLLDLSRNSEANEAREYLDRAISISRVASDRIDLSLAGLQGDPQDETHARAAIRQTIQQLSLSIPLEVRDLLDDSLDSLSPEETLVARRVVNEALWNAGKHSGATGVKIECGMEMGCPLLSVSDDGSGFDEASTTPGLGLGLMRRRVREAGATLEIHSVSGKGTEVRVRFAKR